MCIFGPVQFLVIENVFSNSISTRKKIEIICQICILLMKFLGSILLLQNSSRVNPLWNRRTIFWILVIFQFSLSQQFHKKFPYLNRHHLHHYYYHHYLFNQSQYQYYYQNHHYIDHSLCNFASEKPQIVTNSSYLCNILSMS